MPDTSIAVRLRPATAADARQIWEWRNEPAVRAGSFTTDAIPLADHLDWYARSSQAGRRFYIAVTTEGLDIGYVRFDRANDKAEMSVCLDSAFRHRGFGRVVIADGARLCLRETGVRRVVAFVKCGNDASLAAFKAAGFTLRSREARGGAEAWVLDYDDAPSGSP